MPCSDGGPDPQQEKIDRLTRMLCATSRKLRGDEMDEDQKVALHEAQAWLIKHDKKDRERKAREAEAAMADEHRRSAWAKLTPAERRALRLGEY